MKKMVCEICGSSNIIKKDGVFVCQTCGMQYSTEDAKKLLRDIEETPVIKEKVTVSNSSVDPNLDNLYKLARRARKNDDDEAAAKYYETISVQCPDDWEALFYSAYCRASQIKVGEIPNTMITFSKTALSTLELISEASASLNDVREIVKEVCDLYGSFMMSLYYQGKETSGGAVNSNIRVYLPLFADKVSELFPDYKSFIYEIYEDAADLYKDDVMSDNLDVFHPSKESYRKYSSEEAKKELEDFEEYLEDSDGEPSRNECDIAIDLYNKMQAIDYKDDVDNIVSDIRRKVESLNREVQQIKDEWNQLIANPTDKTLNTFRPNTDSSPASTVVNKSSTTKKPVVLIIGIILLVLGLVFLIIGISCGVKVSNATNDNSISFSEASRIIDKYTPGEVVGFLFGIPDLIAGLVLTIIGVKKARR